MLKAFLSTFLCVRVCLCVRVLGAKSLLVYDNVRTCKSHFMHIPTDCKILCPCVPCPQQQCGNKQQKGTTNLTNSEIVGLQI